MKNKSLEYKKYISLVRKFNKLNSKINQLILDKDKLIELCNLNEYRGQHSHSITYLDINTMKILHVQRSLGPLLYKDINPPNQMHGIYIIIQNMKRLQFNILEHTLVPKHRVMLDDEVIIVKTKYNINNNTQFPDISRFDPVAQAICIRPGEICEIIRPSKTAIQAPYYRICV